jgi:anaerobic selenocysteine-containing dehydrogenase
MTGGKSYKKTVYKALGLAGLLGGGSPCAVDTKDGKITRIRPLHYDSKYAREEIKPWRIQKNGKSLETPLKSMPSPISIAYKKRAYSPNRILYPLKRIDWDPEGERHTENRGMSKYRRISWDEAASIIANEIGRVYKHYGPA